ncbi:hypothetical protein MTsPCn5_15300 [Croceitalea sp. MTPC5]|uniref:hypothetical protein n=1 Tax=Croceitalea sp. MTPC5 TaxID=3056565 RepID=UPI002B3A5AA7|nr:hypothetical protein MTsPCn5_15300 [Croceitalea sp. MTPC5]
MKNGCHQLDRPSLLYIILEELVFLKETRKTTAYILNVLKRSYNGVKAKYRRVVKNEWTQAYLILAGYMTFSTLLLFVTYKLVMIY